MNKEKQKYIKLDIGCGQNKKLGFKGLDKIKMIGVDIVCDLEKEKMPINDSSVQETFSMHFLEHTNNLVQVMEEIWRVSTNGARVVLAVPYYNSIGAYRDPTHKRFFTYDTFDYFTNTVAYPSFYTKAKFKIIKKRILFYPANSNIRGIIPKLYKLPFQILVNIFPALYENSFLKIFPANDLYVELKTIKL